MLFLLSFPGLSGESIKYKAQSYDMYAKSSALQQRFLPQPVMRSSWQQLVMFGLSLIYCHVRACPEHLPWRHPRVYPTSDVIPGFTLPLMSSPGLTRGSSGFPCQNRKWQHFFSSSSGKRSAFRGSLDSPVKPGNDRKERKKSPTTTIKKMSLPDFSHFCHVRACPGHLPYRFPGQAGE